MQIYTDFDISEIITLMLYYTFFSRMGKILPWYPDSSLFPNLDFLKVSHKIPWSVFFYWRYPQRCFSIWGLRVCSSPSLFVLLFACLFVDNACNPPHTLTHTVTGPEGEMVVLIEMRHAGSWAWRSVCQQGLTGRPTYHTAWSHHSPQPTPRLL